MVRRLALLYPYDAPVKPEAARIAVRPIPGDRVAVLGFMPQLEGYYLVTTHSGVTQGPFLAELVADEVGGAGSGRNWPISGPPGSSHEAGA